MPQFMYPFVFARILLHCTIIYTFCSARKHQWLFNPVGVCAWVLQSFKLVQSMAGFK